MADLVRFEIITGERVVYAADVESVTLPGVEGELTVLPRHAPLLTMLKPGELVVRRGGEEVTMAVSGGFLEVMPDKVVVLADTAERAEEIDIARAEAARRRAEESLRQAVTEEDLARARAALQRALVRLRVAERRRRRERPLRSVGEPGA